MTAFFVIVGISVVGVAVVFWLLSKEKTEEETAEPFSLEAIQKKEIEGVAPRDKEAPKSKNPFAKIKFPGKKKEPEPEVDEAEPAEPPSGKSSPLAKLGLDKMLSKLKLPSKKKKNDAEEIEQDREETPAKPNPLQNILSKFKRGKKNLDDDIPQPTNFASLKQKLSQFSKNPAKDVENDKPMPLLRDTGTVSMKTVSDTPKSVLSEKEKQSIDAEVDSATELAELKNKYGTMEKLLTEKNAELEKNKTTYDSEVTHRKDFNKIKDLLEKELKEVKERVKTVKQETANAVQERDNAFKRVKVLEEKATKLEKEIAALEKDNEYFRKQIKQAGLKDAPPRPAVEEAAPAAAEEEPPAAPAAPPPPPEPPPVMEPPPVFREAAAKSKMNKDDISRFEESLGFSSEPAAETPAAPPVPPKEEPIEIPKPVDAPPAAVIEPPVPEPAVQEAPAPEPVPQEPAAPEPVQEAAAPEPVQEPVAEEPPAPPPPPFAPEPPAPPASEGFAAPPPRDDETSEDASEEDADKDRGGFLKLSPDPMSGPKPASPPEPTDKPEDKKE